MFSKDGPSMNTESRQSTKRKPAYRPTQYMHQPSIKTTAESCDSQHAGKEIKKHIPMLTDNQLKKIHSNLTLKILIWRVHTPQH